MAKKSKDEQVEEQREEQRRPDDLVRFRTSQAWAGLRVEDREGNVVEPEFNLAAGDECLVKRYVAEARQAAGLGEYLGEAE
jgi:hypothetical protein